MVDDITFRLPFNYKNDNCQLDFSWNSAAYGNVDSSASVLTPTNYTNGNAPYIKSTGSNVVNLCRYSSTNRLNN